MGLRFFASLRMTARCVVILSEAKSRYIGILDESGNLAVGWLLDLSHPFLTPRKKRVHDFTALPREPMNPLTH